ncbi:MAG: hypothetical protein ACHQDD_02995 [Steroidobacterales bacterium]
MSAIADSVAVGLVRPHLQQTKSSVEFIIATDMPALTRPGPENSSPTPLADFYLYFTMAWE